jgi:hypothetical protein
MTAPAPTVRLFDPVACDVPTDQAQIGDAYEFVHRGRLCDGQVVLVLDGPRPDLLRLLLVITRIRPAGDHG